MPIFDGEGRLLASETETVSGARGMRFSALRERVKREKRGRGVLTTAEERINSLKWGPKQIKPNFLQTVSVRSGLPACDSIDHP